MDCDSLSLFVVPAQLEIIDANIFAGCDSVSQLIFEIPSGLRNLHLPMDDFVSLSIPDSVEGLTGLLRKCKGHNRLLEFSPESRLMKIQLSRSINPWEYGLTVGGPEGLAVFVCLSEGTLRRFRCSFEGF
jgi:hypothetical protein